MQKYIYDLEKIKKDLSLGISLTKIKGNRNTISKILKENNIEIPNKNNKLYNYNDTIFEIIDTEEKAYWLGFLYADGNVTKRLIKKENRKDKFSYQLELSLAEVDKDHLIKFGRFMFQDFNEEKNLKKKIIKLKEKEYIAYKITINSKKIVEDLIKLGCVPKKSLILTYPTEEQIPFKLQHHFIRGYFDGDGCVSFNNFKKIMF